MSLKDWTYRRLKKNIKLAKHAGFCYGVKRAVETTKKINIENRDKEIFVLGELIHNSHVINELSNLGIHTVDDLPNNNSGVCVIRSHGAAPEVFENAKNKGYEVVDLTCLDVKKVQQKAIELVKDEYLLVIVGKPEHPEVCAIKANAQAFGEKILVSPDVDSLVAFEDEIKKHIQEFYYKLDFNYEDLKENYKYDETSQGTVPQAIYCFLISNDFEDALRTAVSIGGDSDTLCAITGAIAEAFYGIPEQIKATAKKYMDRYIIKSYKTFVKKSNYKAYIND